MHIQAVVLIEDWKMHFVVLWINDKKMATSNHGDVATVHSRGKSICFATNMLQNRLDVYNEIKLWFFPS